MKEIVEFENENFNHSSKYMKFRRLLPKFLTGLVIIVIFVIVVVISISRKSADSMLYEAKISEYEIYCEAKAYILNSETIVDYDKNSTIVTLAEETKRISLGDVIAMYKTAEYDKNKQKLSELDEKINDKLALIAPTYSNAVIQIESEINSIIQEVKNTSSYIEINEYKSKLDELAYKKAKIIASLDPSSAELLEIMSNRDQFKESMNSSASNIKANISGVVIYKTDGLEGKFTTDEFNISKVKDIMKSYNSANKEVFGIKIVDNFESYLIIEENNVNNKIYMKEGGTYNLELLSKDASLKGTLINIIDSEDKTKVYCVFRVTNGVENLVESRTLDIKVIWKKYSGFFVNNTSLQKKGDVDYVQILSLNEYIDIPVKTIATLDDRSLVVNYSKAELEEIGIKRERRLLLYDRVVKDISAIKR